MKKRMKKVMFTFLSLSMVLGLSACGGNAKESEGKGNGKTASAEKTIVKCIAQGELAKNLENVAKQLEDGGSSYKFEIEEVSLDNLDQKINLAHAANQDYDFIFVNNSSIKQFSGANVLEPLDEYMKESGIDFEKNYSEALLKVGMVDQTQYAIPIAPDCRVLAYNKKLVEDGGFEAPKTQADIMEIAKALTKDGVYAYARQMDTSLAPAYNEGCFLMGNGAYICKEENQKVVAACDSKEMTESVKWWQEMKNYMPKDVNTSADQVREMFAQGKLVFYIFGPWEFNELKNMEYGKDYELMPTPGNQKNGATMGGWYCGIGSGGKNKEGAKELLSKLLEPETICAMKAGLPADNRCYEMDAYSDEKYKPFLEAFKTAEPPMPITAQFNKINDIFFEYFNKALVGGEDAEAVMKECNEKIQALLDED